MKRYISLLMGLLAFIPISAQQSDYYYYYKGNRIDLEVDSTRLYVVSEGELQEKAKASVSTRTVDYTINSSTKSYVHNHVVSLQQRRGTIPEIYFSKLEVPKGLDSTQFDALVEKLKSEDNVWQVLPSFIVNGIQINITNNFYVKLKSSDDIDKLYQLSEELAIEIVGYNEFMPLWYTLSCNATSSMNAIEAANHFHQSQMFACCKPEFSYSKALHSDDEKFPEQWNLKNTGDIYGIEGIDINVEHAWEVSKGNNVVVAVFDQGVYTSHPDLQANISTKSYNAATGESPSVIVNNSGRGHGTACAGIIGAIQNNGIGISGIAPEVTLMPISLSFVEGEFNEQQIANGFNWAWKNGADIISNSWGDLSEFDLIDEAIDSAICRGRYGKGSIVVFSAGNEGDSIISYPANCNPRIITVGGITPYGERTIGGKDENDYFILFSSNYGEQLDVVAPSIHVPTTYISNNGGYLSSSYYSFSGTSAACPHVAGIAALMLSIDPNLTTDEVHYIIGNTARKIRTDLYSYQTDTIHKNGTWNNEMGYGLVDATAAVEFAKKTAETTYIRNQTFDRSTQIEYYYDKNIELENVVVESGGRLEIDKDNAVLLKSSVWVMKGGELKIYKQPEQ